MSQWSLPRPQPPPAGVPHPSLLQQQNQELQARLDEYRRLHTQAVSLQANWARVARKLVALLAPDELHERHRQEPAWAEEATPADWLLVAQEGYHKRQQPQPPAPVDPQPGAQTDPPLTESLPETGAGPAGACLPPTAPAPVAPGPAVAAAPPVARVGPAAGDPEPELPTPWWQDWTGAGTLNPNLAAHVHPWLLQRGFVRCPPAAGWTWPTGRESWMRQLCVLCLIAETGQVVQRALICHLQRLAQTADPWKNAGNLKRDCELLASYGLVARTTLSVAAGRREISTIILQLTPTGREWLQAQGLPTSVEDDWSRLQRLHGGEHQHSHNARTLLAASTLRLWAWQVELLPQVSNPAEPDLLLTAPGQLPWPCEVEAGSGSVERRHRKWQHAAALHPDAPRLALIAPEAGRLASLVREARASVPEMRLLVGALDHFTLPASLAAAPRTAPPLALLEPDAPLAVLPDLTPAAV